MCFCLVTHTLGVYSILAMFLERLSAPFAYRNILICNNTATICNKTRLVELK